MGNDSNLKRVPVPGITQVASYLAEKEVVVVGGHICHWMYSTNQSQ